MKVNKSQTLLVVGGIFAIIAGKDEALATTTTAHADIQNKDKNTKRQDIIKIDSSKNNSDSK